MDAQGCFYRVGPAAATCNQGMQSTRRAAGNTILKQQQRARGGVECRSEGTAQSAGIQIIMRSRHMTAQVQCSKALPSRWIRQQEVTTLSDS